ncbi:MAG: Rrf2 family transcriptional regulator [Alphaproteobacteria bacterium]|nr:Rrf2 family transcriptional regulator [Alphaproteobacteria bacterium]
MTLFSPARRLMFATEAVLRIADQPANEAVSSRELTAEQGIPPRYLEEVLQALVHAGILVGRRGPRGGYRLARPAGYITLEDIVSVVQPGCFSLGSEADEGAQEGREARSTALGRQVVAPAFDRVRSQIQDLLGSVTIDDLRQAAQAERGEAPSQRQLDLMELVG